MSNISSNFNGGTLLEVGLPSHLSGASPTTYYCGNLIWRQFLQGKTVTETVEKKQAFTSFEQPATQTYTNLHFHACVGSTKDSTNAFESSSSGELNKMDHHGNTPLIWAASEGNDDIVQLLVEQGANVNTQNFAGETALFLAAARGFDTIVHTLLENGANVQITNLDGATALHMAVANGNLSTMTLLVKYGAFVNSQDDNGDTPLHYAVREEQARLVEMLVSHCNADVDLMNDDQETPLELASCLESTNIVRILSHFAKEGMTVEGEDKYGGSTQMLMVHGHFDM
jgi:ankyrin repeat protein